MPERQTPLLERHRALGARLVDFAGWQMPLQYTGVIAEHNAVRSDVGVFDVSHLGKLRVRGDGEALQHALSADVLALAPHRARYSLVLADDAGCIDDVFVYRVSEDEWLVVPNAANVFAVAEAIRASGGDAVDEWDRWAILAIQGPRSFDLFERAFRDSRATELKLHAWCELDVFGEQGFVARTGYTGERGFELYAPSPTAPRALDHLIELGTTPVGLGARDTLRLEMGYALYGHELTREINPLEAGLGWAIAWDTAFRGREALLKVKEEGPARRAVAIRCTGRGVPREGYEVWYEERPIGRITSGNFSPTLATGVALALVDAAEAERLQPGTKVAIDARGKRIEGDIVKPPFVRTGAAKGPTTTTPQGKG